MGFLDAISSVVSPIASLGGLVSGLFGEDSARKQQEAGIQSLKASNAAEQYGLQQNDARNLLASTGLGGDAIRNLGSSLGSGFANAGLYNSSAVAGGLLQAQRQENTSLADLAARQRFNEQQLASQQAGDVARMQYNLGGQNLGYARQDLGTAASGLQSYLQSMTQHALQASGNTMTPGGGNGTTGMWGTLPTSYGPGYNAAGYPKNAGLPKAPDLTGLRFPTFTF